MATTASDPTVILSIARTPMGSMQGALADATATDLGATAVKAAVERAESRVTTSTASTWAASFLRALARHRPVRQRSRLASQVGAGDDGQQGLRIRNADRDHGR